MENVNCDLCGEDITKLLFKVKDFRYQGKQVFNLVKCKKCNLVYINPRPQSQELRKYYDRYYSYKSIHNGSQKEKYSFLKHCDVKRLEKYKDKGRILDIGCGKGDFLAKIANTGWEVIGTELHPEAAIYAREKNKLEVHEKELSKINFPLKTFDVVRLHHVIEHLTSPQKTLKIIRDILKDDGLLIIACPNFTSFFEIVFADKWDALDVPRHLYQFNGETLNKLLRKSGFEAVNTYHNQLFQNMVVMKKSIFNKFNLMNYQPVEPAHKLKIDQNKLQNCRSNILNLVNVL
ncbi:SAM-dependent methyltransferases [Olavius algarvensis Delta 1 endosymbiont]|nr:SAM-dependent methyltransferases [Olavius algarvensis Delta 1 endosymbiont]